MLVSATNKQQESTRVDFGISNSQTEIRFELYCWLPILRQFLFLDDVAPAHLNLRGGGVWQIGHTFPEKSIPIPATVNLPAPVNQIR